jgi:hypothetical protein
VFSFSKIGDVWILHFEISPLRQALLICAGWQAWSLPWWSCPPGHGWSLSCRRFRAWPSWLTGLPRTHRPRRVSISGNAASTLKAGGRGSARCANSHSPTWRHAMSSNGRVIRTIIWEAILELYAGQRIKLGTETEGRTDGVLQYLEDIRTATGIAGRDP